ncbi:hypothetical protein TW85_15780 [Marinomonas sp. S3726]|uniref:hypothetical protein n=1 Tax=Marinomonas sp. S3726 TaxID=579484 RepID=UPI0005FA0749|nr:hypothetical protein [Marinomonas sp. S3726]KJZ12541.1 hypothetical protein TW85_15780 [Marinomonas sp. S3726]
MKTYSFEHENETYTVSLDWLATRNMYVNEANNHIHTDQIWLTKDKRVCDYKNGYKEFKETGGTLKKKAYLDKVAFSEFSADWDTVIEFAKTNMRDQYNFQNEWVTTEDHLRLGMLAQSGHATAAYHIGCQFMKQNDDMAVSFLVNAHNYGHVGGLYRLSGYLAKKNNFDAAIACLVIAADYGNDIAIMSVSHWETMSYLIKASSEGINITNVLSDLATTSRYSTVRYLQLFEMLITNNKGSLNKLNDIISSPQNHPKKNDLSEAYSKRGSLVKAFFNDLKREITDNKGNLLKMSVMEYIDAYKKIASKDEFYLFSFKDFMELDSYFNP